MNFLIQQQQCQTKLSRNQFRCLSSPANLSQDRIVLLEKVSLSVRQFQGNSVLMCQKRSLQHRIKQECRSVPRQKCENVPRQAYTNVPKQECRNVLRQECRNVPRQQFNNATMPRQQCRSKCNLYQNKQKRRMQQLSRKVEKQDMSIFLDKYQKKNVESAQTKVPKCSQTEL